MAAFLPGTEGMQHALKYGGSVCQIDTASPGTGFLVTPRIILTCSHVLLSVEAAEKAWARFVIQEGSITIKLNPYEKIPMTGISGGSSKAF